mmetsp:Transcript_10591/g.17680  ORF Transcript_10591/g.17680 Transcript_10591/m.17680 type:complete len:162 (-) Transcript_10591:8-493(-)
MVKLQLKISATLENCTNLTVPEDYLFPLKLKCENCGEVSDKFITVDRTNEETPPGSRGSVNVVYCCKLCKRKHTLSVDSVSGALTKEDSDSGKFATIATFECRGVDIEEFEPRDGWQCEGAEDSKSKFTDVDLADDEFCDYDEQKDLPVSISDFKFKFEVA